MSIVVKKRAASGEAIDEIKLEFLALWVDIQPIEVRPKVAAQYVQFCLAMRFDVRWRFVRMPLEGHGRFFPLGAWAWRYALPLPVRARRPWAFVPPHCLKKKGTSARAQRSRMS